MITSQKQKEEEESKLVEELKVTKGLLDKAYEDLVIKTNALDAELEKVNVSEVSIQTDPEINEVSVKQEESKDNIEEKYKEIPCQYFHKIKGCRRGNKWWFYRDKSLKTGKQSSLLKQNINKKVKDELNVDMETKNEQNVNSKKVIIELVKLLLKEGDI